MNKEVRKSIYEQNENINNVIETIKNRISETEKYNI